MAGSAGAWYRVRFPLTGTFDADATMIASLGLVSLLLLSGDDAPDWDVNAPPGEWRDVAIDTDEGTWMNVDVSPDGRTIVFDLLGDLYTLPINGGDATCIREGIAWEMQPRFSPEGDRIAFTSDAGGGDNLWVMNRDGSDARQVTKESFRLLNSPAWSPHGEYIAGRKHFTSRRSLGAGEVWLYHVSGGSGLQMTTRPTEQKDVGEPAFSPDGRYVYFSLDATPGSTFEYSKDSNGQIYVIRRLDRETGDITPVVTGPGGAVRPTPSPDGKWLAFVRRVRFETRLFLLDLESGETRELYAPLERDMQETWAVHGVYPTMAFTPDSASIVFYAGGKIRRVDVESGESEVIPFRVTDTRSVQAAIRFQVDVAPDEFDVKALRWVRVSPSGDRVVYQALGHLYVKELPDGEPRRLTAQTDHFEFHPSFSRDGRSIVYTTFDDVELGEIRVAPARGGEGRKIASVGRGHFVDPVFTPDGSQVVYGRVSGGGITSPLFSYDAGLYRVATDGESAPVRVTRRGTNPHFGASGDRVYLTTTKGGDTDRRTLISVDLDGGDERSHLESDWATGYRVSPDGSHVAFIERFQVHVAPFVPTGREVKIGPKTDAFPVRQVSEDAGENLQWSGDSASLYWSLGPSLYRREIDRRFGDEESAPPGGVHISFTASHARPDGVVALVGGRVITMRGDEVLERGTVVVDGNRIVAVGPAGEVEVPSGATRVDCEGHTLMPGLVDVHHHGSHATNGLTPKRNWQHHASLAFGITTTHDPSHDTNSIHAVAEMARAGVVLAPRMYSTGTILYGAAGSFKAVVEGLDDARSHLRRLQAVGAHTVKSYNQPRRDQRQQVIAAAHEVGMMVVPEGGSVLQHNLTFVVDGHTGVEHSLPVERIFKDVTQLWAGSGVGYTPTLIVGYGGIWGENYWYDTTDVWANERLMTFTPRRPIDERSRRRTKAPVEEYNHLRSAGICKALVDAGARCQLGAHGQLQGLGSHWELWMLEQGGLTKHEALRAATLDGAFYVGLDRDVGSIEVGKLADILVLEHNPLDDIRHSESIRYTMLNGRVYDARTLSPLGEEARPRFWFHDVDAGLPGHSHAGCVGCTVAPPVPPAGYR